MQDFLKQISPYARAVGSRIGLDPRIIMAQAALETGWGKHAPGNNFFGIKSHGQGGGQNLPTMEVVNGQPVQTNASFRQYPNMGASVEGYGEFITSNPRYKPMLAAKGLDAQIAALGASGYATDPRYAEKVANIARKIQPAGQQPVNAPPKRATVQQPVNNLPKRGVAQELNQMQGILAPGLRQKPRGLLPVEEPQAPQAEESFFNSDTVGNVLDGLAVGFNTLRWRPDPAINRGVEQRRARRSRDKRLNQTAEMLRKGGAGELAGLVETGALSAKDALGLMLSTPEDTRTSLMKNVDSLMQRGMSQEDAMAYLKSGGAPDRYKIVPGIGLVDVQAEGSPKVVVGTEGGPDVKGEGDLRKEFTSLTKDFRAVRDSYSRVETSAAKPTAAGDIALIFNYMKMLDPGSVVRESEFALAAAAGDLGDKWVGIGKRLLTGERLADSVRADFVGKARQLYAARRMQYDSTEGTYRDIAGQYGYEPERAVPDFKSKMAPVSLGTLPPEFQTQLQSEKPGTKVKGPDGVVYVWDGESLIPQ